MPYKILPATSADLPEIIAIYHAAFANDPFIGQLTPNVPPGVKQAYDMHWSWTEMGTTTLHAEFDNGIMYSLLVRQLLGFAKWQYPYTLTPEQKTKKAELDRIEELEHPFPEGSNRELYEVFFAALREKKAKWMDESKDYLLHILGVSPAHQRKGLGAMLIREGLEDADRNNSMTYIEASPAGYELYLRHGWKQADEIVIDISKYGGHGVATERLLLREPGGNQRLSSKAS